MSCQANRLQLFSPVAPLQCIRFHKLAPIQKDLPSRMNMRYPVSRRILFSRFLPDRDRIGVKQLQGRLRLPFCQVPAQIQDYFPRALPYKSNYPQPMLQPSWVHILVKIKHGIRNLYEYLQIDGTIRVFHSETKGFSWFSSQYHLSLSQKLCGTEGLCPLDDPHLSHGLP